MVKMMAVGLPVITTNLQGVRWVLRDYSCKFLTEKLDETSLREAILSILKMKDNIICKRCFDYNSSLLAKRLLVEIFNIIREIKWKFGSQ